MTMEATMAVLILVLMEYKWNKKDMGSPQMGMDCLNPCFNGIQMEHAAKVESYSEEMS